MSAEAMVNLALNIAAFGIALTALVSNMKKAGKDEIAALRVELQSCEKRCQERLEENITLLRDLAKQSRLDRVEHE